ncbi:putative eukaryotic translation initiation factor 3 subunit B [Helianthus debilis subsp. tardiflorus]
MFCFGFEQAPSPIRLKYFKLIDFSPGEKYLVTCSSHEPSNPRDTHRVVLNIFDVRTGKIMKGFNERADEFVFGEIGGFTGVSWPVFSFHGGHSRHPCCVPEGGRNIEEA